MTPRVSSGPAGAIRPIASAVIRDRERILVWEDLDPATGEVVSVPLAGGIEFGETGEAAIRRELLEEIGAAAAEPVNVPISTARATPMARTSISLSMLTTRDRPPLAVPSMRWPWTTAVDPPNVTSAASRSTAGQRR